MSDPQPPPIVLPPPVPPPAIPPEPAPMTEEEAWAQIEALPDVGFPVWVKAVGAVTLLLVIFSITRIPKAISASVAEARGEKYMAANQPDKAVVEFEKNMKDFPDSERAILHLTEAYLGANRPEDAANVLIKLEGKRLDKTASRQADELASQISAKLDHEEQP